MSRLINVIAAEIRSDWSNVWFGAEPYVQAMESMNTLEDGYLFPGRNAGESVVVGFLGNAQTWRGEVARRIKKELKSMVSVK